MAKFVVFWHVSPTAPWPTDPTEFLKLNEMMWAATDNLLKTGQLLEFGYFQDGISGYGITSGDSVDMFSKSSSFWPWVISEPHEVVPYEAAKEVMRALCKAQAEQMAAMKQ